MARDTIDKWKSKKFFNVVAPPLFKGAVIGQTVANDPKKIPGRIVIVNYSSVLGDTSSRQTRVKLRFRIKDVQGERAVTEFLGHSLIQDYERSLVRRRTSKIYVNQVVTTKDGKPLRVKAFVVTQRQINRSKKSDICKRLHEFVAQDAQTQSFNDYIHDAVSGRTAMRIKKALQKLYPLRIAVVQKTEIVTGRSKLSPAQKPKTEAKPKESKPIEGVAPEEVVKEEATGPEEVIEEEVVVEEITEPEAVPEAVVEDVVEEEVVETPAEEASAE